MILSFHPCIVADRQIILGDRPLSREDLALILRAKVIILPQGCPRKLYEACREGAALLFPDYGARFKFPGKIGQVLLFRKLNFPCPDSAIWKSVKDFSAACGKAKDLPHSTPFLIKSDNSHEAEGVYVISDQKDLEACLENLSRAEKEGRAGFLSQDLIPSLGDVLRAVIIGKKVITYWKRAERPGQIITTIGRGAKLDKAWRPDLQAKGRARTLDFSAASGINLAAVDLIFSIKDPEPQPLFLEINYYFGRRGLGGSLAYYRLLFNALKEWLASNDMDPARVSLV